MELLKERILKDGVVKPGNVLKVDSFLNHQMDIPFINELGKEFKRIFADAPINKILTIEDSIGAFRDLWIRRSYDLSSGLHSTSFYSVETLALDVYRGNFPANNSILSELFVRICREFEQKRN